MNSLPEFTATALSSDFASLRAPG
jgi:hypothetical protein